MKLTLSNIGADAIIANLTLRSLAKDSSSCDETIALRLKDARNNERQQVGNWQQAIRILLKTCHDNKKQINTELQIAAQLTWHALIVEVLKKWVPGISGANEAASCISTSSGTNTDQRIEEWCPTQTWVCFYLPDCSSICRSLKSPAPIAGKEFVFVSNIPEGGIRTEPAAVGIKAQAVKFIVISPFVCFCCGGNYNWESPTIWFGACALSTKNGFAAFKIVAQGI